MRYDLVLLCLTSYAHLLNPIVYLQFNKGNVTIQPMDDSGVTTGKLHVLRESKFPSCGNGLVILESGYE